MSSLGNGWNFLVGSSRTFQSIQFIDSVDVKFNELFAAMKGPKIITLPRGHFYFTGVWRFSQFNHRRRRNCNGPSRTPCDNSPPSESLVLQWHRPCPKRSDASFDANLGYSCHASDGLWRPILQCSSDVKPLVPTRSSQRHHAPAPRFDVDASNRASQLEYNL